MRLLEQIAVTLQCGDSDGIVDLLKKALDDKMSPGDILNNGLIAGMNIIGEKYKHHEIFLPEVMLAARAMHVGMDILKPLFLKDEVPALGRVVIGTVQGDIHDIGKNLVAIMLKGAGFEVIDLGKDVPPDKFVATAVEQQANVIGMSALLTTTMPVMKKVIEQLKERGLNGKIKTIIGGAPVSEEFAMHIGADAYGYDSVHAIDCIKKLVSES
jgi:5-methyltetrahydrofolate--homocysteine methyltransferase